MPEKRRKIKFHLQLPIMKKILRRTINIITKTTETKIKIINIFLHKDDINGKF